MLAEALALLAVGLVEARGLAAGSVTAAESGSDTLLLIMTGARRPNHVARVEWTWSDTSLSCFCVR